MESSLRQHDYIMGDMIGEGTYSSVYACTHVKSNRRVAIKAISKEQLSTNEKLTALQRELECLKMVRCPFIVRLYEHFEDAGYFYFVMELVEGITLLEYIKKNGRLNEEEARNVFCQIVTGIEHLHNQCFIAHRDMKCENIIIGVHMHIKIIDFGFSIPMVDKGSIMKTHWGSPHYSAPELFKNQNYTNATDIWALGVILYVMLYGHFPFNDENYQQMAQLIVETDTPFPYRFSNDLMALLDVLLQKDPSKRPLISSIPQFPWIAKSKMKSFFDEFEETITGSNDYLFEKKAMNNSENNTLRANSICSKSCGNTTFDDIFNDVQFSNDTTRSIMSKYSAGEYIQPKRQSTQFLKSHSSPDKKPYFSRIGNFAITTCSTHKSLNSSLGMKKTKHTGFL